VPGFAADGTEVTITRVDNPSERILQPKTPSHSVRLGIAGLITLVFGMILAPPEEQAS